MQSEEQGHIIEDYKVEVWQSHLEIERLQKERDAEGCTWEQEDWEGDTWHCNQCGATWIFTYGGPGENGMKYCMECGRKITDTQPWADEEAEAALEKEKSDAF